MDKSKFIERLKSLAANPLLSQFAIEALSLVESAKKTTIIDHRGNATADRLSLLDTYVLRQRRLAKNGTRLSGFEATIAALSKHACERVKLVTINLEVDSIALLLDPDGEIIGGYILKESLNKS